MNIASKIIIMPTSLSNIYMPFGNGEEAQHTILYDPAFFHESISITDYNFKTLLYHVCMLDSKHFPFDLLHAVLDLLLTYKTKNNTIITV